MGSLKIKQKYLVLAILLLIMGGGLGLYWKGISGMFCTSSTLPSLVAPPKTYVFLDSRNGEIVHKYQAYEKILPGYIAYLKKRPSSEGNDMVRLIVGRLYYELREFSEAKQYLLPLFDCGQAELAYKAGEILAVIAYQTGDFSSIEPLVDELHERYPRQNQTILLSWKANAWAKSGLTEEAFQLYDQLILTETDVDLRKELNRRKANLTWQLKPGTGVIEGYVEVASGSGLANIPVYLTNIAGVKTITPAADLPITYTDQNGFYRFSGLAEGTYNVGIELRQDLFSGNVTTNTRGRLVTLSKIAQTSAVNFKIHPEVALLSPKPGETIAKRAKGKVLFRWKEFEGAAYYLISIAGVSQVPVDATDSIRAGTRSFESEYVNNGTWTISNPKGLIKIYDTKVEIDLNSPFEYVSRQEYSAEFIVPSYVLSWAYPGSKLIWRVQAYDEKGTLVGDSNSQIDPTYKPYIVFEEGELDPGDQELLDGKYERALEIYLEELNHDPDNQKLVSKVRNLVTGLKNFYYESFSKVIDVLQRVQEEKKIPADVLNYILRKFETEPLWEITVQGFVLGTEKQEVPLSWKLYFEPVIQELDQEELAQIRSQILERRFDADFKQMEGASLTRLLMGLYYKWLTDQTFRSPASEEYQAYCRAILAQSGQWYAELKQFLENLNARKENYIRANIPY